MNQWGGIEPSGPDDLNHLQDHIQNETNMQTKRRTLTQEEELQILQTKRRTFEEQDQFQTKRRTLTQEDKFHILHRDKFTCRYCGAKPGAETLEVDHLIPVSLGGSDDPLNLVASCYACNRRRSDQPLFPHDMILGTDDDEWHIVRRRGVWTIKACRRGVVVAGAVYGTHDPFISGCEYWFDVGRAHEEDWVSHISGKDWPLPHKLGDFLDCLELARRMTISDL